MNNFDRDLEAQLEAEVRKQEEAEGRYSIVHQPRHAPVRVEPEIYPVTPYHPERGYPPYPYPPQRSGPGWGGVLLAVLLMSAPTYFIGYQFILQQKDFNARQERSDALRDRTAAEQNKTILTLVDDVRKGFGQQVQTLDRAFQASEKKSDEVIAAVRETADAKVEREREEAKRRQAEQNARNLTRSYPQAEADKKQLVSRLEKTVKIIEKRLGDVGFLGNCVFNGDCEKKQSFLRDKLTQAKLILESARNLPVASIVTNRQTLEKLEKETDELTKSIGPS